MYIIVWSYLYEVSRWAVSVQAVRSQDLGPQGERSAQRGPEGVSGILVCDFMICFVI